MRSQPFPLPQESPIRERLAVQFILQALLDSFARLDGSVQKLIFYSELLLEGPDLCNDEISELITDLKVELVRGKYPHEKLCQFAHLFTSLLKQMLLDENILLLFIENRDRLNDYVGHHFVEKWLSALFPEGPPKLCQIIEDGYRKRGFDSFLKSIQPLLNAIRWETPCHSLMTH
jgi:hypothetical protein